MFHRPDRDPRRRETSSLLPMLPLRPRREEDESEWLLRHPVVDAFVSLRWRQARAAVFFSVLLLICFAIAVTSCFAKYSEVAPTPAGVSGRRRQVRLATAKTLVELAHKMQTHFFYESLLYSAGSCFPSPSAGGSRSPWLWSWPWRQFCQ